MTITINGSGTITGATTMASATSFSADVTLGGAGVDILNNSGNKVLGQTGSVLQVVQTFDSAGATYFSTATTGSMVATGFSVAITPSSTSSKILLLVNAAMYNNGANANYTATIYRNSTNLSTGGGAVAGFSASYVNGSLNLGTPVTMSVLDSPATTSAITYQVYVAGNSGTTYFGVAPGFATSRVLSFIAMEIAG